MPEEIVREPFTEKFNFFKAAWRTDDSLPSDWYTEHKTNKPDFHAFFWAPQLKEYATCTELCERNASQFEELISTLNNHNLKNYNLRSLPSPENFTRSDAFNQLDQLGSLEKGDCFLVFYSGIGTINDSSKQASGNTYHAEPLFTGDSVADVNLKSVRTKLRDLAVAKSIHVFLILDVHLVVRGAAEVTSFISSSDSSFVVLESPAPILEDHESIASVHTDNFFYEALADIIQTTGAKMRYSNLTSRMQLRYLQADLPEKPTLTALPPSFLNAYIFSGIFSGKSDYKVYFNEHQQEWQINAGSLNGILPSLSFMHTRFLLDDERLISVKDTFDSYSTLLHFDDRDTENTFEAKLTQNALPKMKVGFHETLSPEMKTTFINTVQSFDIYFIDLLEDREKARFLIKNRDHEYYLVRDGLYRGDHDDRPVFFYQRNVREFIKQLEYIAQWQALLELENSRANVRIGDVETVFQTIEGVEAKADNRDHLPSKKQINPADLLLRYRNGQQPFFRCSVVNKSSAPGPNYFVTFLYLGSRFGIHKLDPFDSDVLTKDDPVWASYVVNGRKLKTIPLQLDSFYPENNVFEIQDYLLVILSAQPLEVAPLTQPGLELYEKPLTRSISLEESKQSFTLPEGDWFVKKIPIRVEYDDRNFEQAVKDAVEKRPVSTPGDQHKNRWGGQAVRNGFELLAAVKNRALGLFEVTLEIRHKESRLTTGEVAFLLNESFSRQIRFEKFDGGMASIRITAYEDFTAAAIIYDGTELELDLSELPGLPKNFYAINPEDKFRQQVKARLERSPVVVPNDLQKARWGGKSEQNGYKLTATVEPLMLRLFNVTLDVTHSQKSFSGQVAFLLHDSFRNPVRIRTFEGNKASVSVTAYEDFTAAAIMDDGTQLELDLSKIPGFPKGFYAKGETDFAAEIEWLLKERSVKVPGDLQKDRWGGKAENNGKIISATVGRDKDTHRVTLTVQSSNNTPLSGRIAYFLHDSFDQPILYRKAVNGKATCVLNSYEAFTVGAYLEDGTELELDLNEQKGYPGTFYYK